jgi:hypothetical protein
MTRRDDRLRLLMLERLSDPDFVYRMVLHPPGDDLVDKLANLVDDPETHKGLTNKQRRVMALAFCGLTQEEIASLMGVCQPTIHKALHGNLVYSGPYAGRRHGGAFWKLAKAAVERTDVRDLLEQITERDKDRRLAAKRGEPPWTRRHPKCLLEKEQL